MGGTSNAIIKGSTTVPGPKQGYRLFVPGNMSLKGNGGASQGIVVVVGHGSVNNLSGFSTWKAYQDDVSDKVDWASAETIYIVSCSTAGEGGNRFAYGNIASEVCSAFAKKAIWASKSAVTAKTGEGDWVKLKC